MEKNLKMQGISKNEMLTGVGILFFFATRGGKNTPG
jgi:hypothetical protein